MHRARHGIQPTTDPWSGLPSIRSACRTRAPRVPEPLVRDKVEPRLADVHREWIAGLPLRFRGHVLAGRSLRRLPERDPPGFVRCWTNQPGHPGAFGNRRMDGFHNIIENPHAGLILLSRDDPRRCGSTGRPGSSPTVRSSTTWWCGRIARRSPCCRGGGGLLPLPQGVGQIQGLEARLLGADVGAALRSHRARAVAAGRVPGLDRGPQRARRHRRPSLYPHTPEETS